VKPALECGYSLPLFWTAVLVRSLGNVLLSRDEPLHAKERKENKESGDKAPHSKKNQDA
jgi:hypothetical protein